MGYMIDLRHLQLIYTIHQQGSMTKAARQLHLTQPALSHQLKELEGKLKTEVFERKGRRLVLTSAGNRLLKAAERVLDEIDRATRDVESLASGKTGVLRLTTECYTCYHWIPSVLEKYNKAFPEIDVKIVPEATKQPIEGLQNNTVDMALVTHAEGLGEGYEVVPLFQDEFICVVHQNHPWAKRTSVEARDFTTEHFIYVKDLFEDSLIFNTLFAAGITPKKLTIIPTPTEAIVGMVRANMGVTVMTSWAAASYLDKSSGLASCKLTRGGIHRLWHAAYPKRKSSCYIDAFIRQLKAAELKSV